MPGKDIKGLLQRLRTLSLPEPLAAADGRGSRRVLRREDLHLVCYEYVWS